MPKSGEQLRELVDSLHPRNPSDVMGEAANSSLLGSTMTAALSTIVVLFAATLIVFFVGDGPDKSTEAATAEAAPTASGPSQPSADEKPDQDVASLETVGSEKPDTETAVEAMGISESKEMDAQPETLENRLDQLLDGLE